MNLTFREKSLWLLLISLIIVFGVYFAAALAQGSTWITPAQIAAFIVAIVVLVVINIMGHALLGIASRRELAADVQTDERDTLIRLKGTRAGYGVLVTGVFLALCTGVFIQGNVAFVHVLLGFWILAQVAEYATQLVMYRRS